ncbi:MAG: cell shape determining protein MreC [Candidatus Scalindua rubra]|uniref:Cell shape-determining protein MreC n=1 Tax=Candidatus Scalindua rubra TaxID=1872076 RepID=A0A1E3XE90_9BACT|nr:MAG: cell shape determining protein MreC [Candidatus Scalindua rubra]
MSLDLGRFPKGFLLYILIVISISLLVIPGSVSNQIKVTVASPLAPVQKIIFQTLNFFQNRLKKIASISEHVDEKEKLEKEVFVLQNNIIKQRNLINMLTRKLETLSEFKKNADSNEKPLIADIIGYDASNFRRSVIIDVGKKQGASSDDAVVFGNALVGRISAVGNSSSRVMLITDPASNVPSRFLESRAQGIVQGTANGTCIMKYVPRQVKVDESDKVISSGIGGVFPKSLYIGNVAEVKQKSANLFKDIKIEPRIVFSKIEHVLVIKKNKKESIKE